MPDMMSHKPSSRLILEPRLLQSRLEKASLESLGSDSTPTFLVTWGKLGFVSGALTVQQVDGIDGQ